MRHLLGLLGTCLLSLAGCASGPKYADVQSSIPPLDAGQGRIYFYRESSAVGAAVQPSIMLDGEKVGDSVPGGFFFVDRAPGKYVAAAGTEVERSLEIALQGGRTEYIRTRITFGALVGHVQVELATPSMFEAAAGELSYTGAPMASLPRSNAPAVATAAASATATATPAPRSASPFPSPGDTWKYRQSKPGQSGGREHVVQVRSAVGGKIVDDLTIAGQAPVETDHTSGAYLINQGVSLFSPYLNVLGPWGSSRVVRSRDTVACPMDVVCTLNSSLAGFERVKLPAGEFATRKIRVEHSWQYHRFGSGRREITVWYADEVKRAVKVRSRTLGGGHVGIETDYDLELVEYKLN
jgi:hypothetical protein